MAVAPDSGNFPSMTVGITFELMLLELNPAFYEDARWIMSDDNWRGIE